MTETRRSQKWNAETSAHPFAKNDRWAIVFDPTPGGIDNGDGTRTFSLRFPALFLSEYVDDPEQAAKDIAQALNEYEPGLLTRADAAEAALAEAQEREQGLLALLAKSEGEKDAAVAAAYEAAAASLEERGSDGWAENVMAEYASVNAEAIRSLATPDQTDALAAMLAEAREEGQREARAAIQWLFSERPDEPKNWVFDTYTTTDDDNAPREGIPRDRRSWVAGPYRIIQQDSDGGLFLLRTPDGKGQVASTRWQEVRAAAMLAEAEARGEERGRREVAQDIIRRVKAAAHDQDISDGAAQWVVDDIRAALEPEDGE